MLAPCTIILGRCLHFGSAISQGTCLRSVHDLERFHLQLHLGREKGLGGEKDIIFTPMCVCALAYTIPY